MGDKKGENSCSVPSQSPKNCGMFSLVLLEASLPHLALARFSSETSEEFNALISDTCLAVGEVK